MDEAERKKTQEKLGLAAELMRIVNQADICLSKISNGFVNHKDEEETKKTIKRIKAEIWKLDYDLDMLLNGD